MYPKVPYIYCHRININKVSNPWTTVTTIRTRMKKMYRVAGQKERWLHAVGAQARGPRLVGAHATRSGREKFDYFSIIFDYFSAAPPPNLVGGGARTNYSIRRRLTEARAWNHTRVCQ